MQFVAFDIETTGFLPRVDQIVEIAAVRFANGKPVDKFCSLVNPKMMIPVGAAAVHGITDDMVKDAPLIETVLEKFAEFCAGDALVAHNAPFDTEFIKADVEKFEAPAPHGIILDTCAMARKVVQGCANYKLGTLVAHLKIPADGTFHRAEADARYCGTLFAMMLERIFTSGQPIVVENLLNLSGTSTLKFPQVVKHSNSSISSRASKF
jgi:DNA polymerase III subunit epsilon